MDAILIVFLLGSTLSFLPIYFALARIQMIPARRGPAKQRRSTVPANEDATGQFLDCLRREAIVRVEAALLDAAAILRHATEAGEVSGSALHREVEQKVSEARKTIASLFPVDSALALDRAILAMQRSTIKGVDPIGIVAELKARLTVQTASIEGAGIRPAGRS